MTAPSKTKRKKKRRSGNNLEKIETEIARRTLEFEVSRSEAETQTAQHEAEAAKLEAELLRFDILNRQEYQDSLDATDANNLVYNFSSEVSKSHVEECISTLRSWDRRHPGKPFTIVFNSPGGSILHGMALFDEIATLSIRGGGGHKITTTVRGYAASMAAILLQAGDVRSMGAESYVMIHEGSTFAMGKTSEVKDEVKFMDKLESRVVDIFVSRSKGKLKRRELRRMMQKTDLWFTSSEAMSYGIVDKIG